MSRAREALGAVALAAASLAVVLVALECVLRFAYPQRTDPRDLFEPHPRLGWRFVPGAERSVVGHRSRRHRIHTNASGFRDGPFEAIPPDHRRLAVLGDSFVSNLSVEREAVFTERLERTLPGLDVMNLGVNGYGPVQELLLLEEVLSRFAPDAVIVNVYLRNDLRDAVGGSWGVVFPKPVARLADSGRVEIVAQPADARPAPPPSRSPLEALHAWRFLRERLTYLRYRLGGGETADLAHARFRAPELELTARRLRRPVRERYEIAQQLLARMDARAREAGVPLLVTLSPSFAQVTPEGWDAVLRQGRARPGDHDRDAPNRRLAAFAHKAGLALLDLSPALRAAASHGGALYDPVEQHWTARGNEIVAGTIAAHLRADPVLRRALALAPPPHAARP